MMMKTLDSKINELRPGQSVELSRTAHGYVTAERSGDGKMLRFVRHTENGFEVFKQMSF